jgi:hypothetical protein
VTDGMHEDVGLLTFPQWVKVQQALADSVQVCAELRSIGDAKIRQEGGGTRASEAPLPLHPGWLLAEEIDGMNLELHDWPDDETAANDEEGAALLIRLMNAVQGAYHRFPIGQERPHTVPTVACQDPTCHGRVLYKPPLEFQDDPHYECTRCGAGQDIEKVIAEVAARAALAEKEAEVKRRKRDRERKAREEARAWA